jgi:hypothetical protein
VLRRDDQNDEIVESGSATSIHPVLFKVHMTGDMAWYAVALGKENSVLDLSTEKVRVAEAQL